MTTLLEATGVFKRFGGVTAVSGVDIRIGRGEMVGLIGPNGSGKTTMFDCLSRMQDIDAGRILFNGTDITRSRPHQVARLGMSRTFQIIRVYRGLTVQENMELSVDWGRIGLRALFSRSGTATHGKAERLLEFLMLAEARGSARRHPVRRPDAPPGDRHVPDERPPSWCCSTRPPRE